MLCEPKPFKTIICTAVRTYTSNLQKNKIHLHHVVRAEAHEPLPLSIHPRMSREHRTVLVDGLPEAGLPERVQALRVQPVGQSFRG